MQISLEPQNCGKWLMKMAIKHENDEFFFTSLKHISGVTGCENRLGTPKLWAIAHENGHKHENDAFFHISQTYIRFYGM
jgi:hypothetical protein